MFAALSDQLPIGQVGKRDDVTDAYGYLMATSSRRGGVLRVDGGTVLV